jgi:hypothetical protein
MRQLLSHEFDDAPVAEYELDAKDCYIASKYMSKRFYGSNTRPIGWKNSATYKFLMYAIVGLFFSGLYNYLRSAGVLAEFDATGFFAGGATALFLTCLIFLPLIFWIIPARISKRMGEAIRGERQRVWRGSNGLAVETTSITVFFDYKGIDEIAALAQGMVVLSGILGFYIPNSAFRTDNQRKEFLALLKSKLESKALSVSSIFAQIVA